MKLNEEQDPRIPEGQARLAKLDGDIASLKEQIAKLENQKSQIQTELAKITGQAGDEAQKNQETQQQEFQKNAEDIAKQAAAEAIANQPTVENIVIHYGDDDIDMLIEEISDKLVYLKNNGGDIMEIDEMVEILEDLKKEKEMTHNINEYASKFRPGKMEWRGKTYNINKVEPVNDIMDIVHIDGKMLSSKHLEADGAKMVPKERKKREKKMTKREYERTLKDVMTSLHSDIDDVDFSIVADQAETLLFDPDLKDYLERKWKKENGMDQWYDPDPTDYDLKELLMNDLEMFESIDEAYVELEDETERGIENYEEEDYVIYVKIGEGNKEFIGKIFKDSPDGPWYTSIKYGGPYKSFEELTFDPSYDEDEILEFLGGTYDEIELIGAGEFNEYIETREKEGAEEGKRYLEDYEDDYEFPDKEMEEGWPTNTL